MVRDNGEQVTGVGEAVCCCPSPLSTNEKVISSIVVGHVTFSFKQRGHPGRAIKHVSDGILFNGLRKIMGSDDVRVRVRVQIHLRSGGELLKSLLNVLLYGL